MNFWVLKILCKLCATLTHDLFTMCHSAHSLDLAPTPCAQTTIDTCWKKFLGVVVEAKAHLEAEKVIPFYKRS